MPRRLAGPVPGRDPWRVLGGRRRLVRPAVLARVDRAVPPVRVRELRVVSPGGVERVVAVAADHPHARPLVAPRHLDRVVAVVGVEADLLRLLAVEDAVEGLAPRLAVRAQDVDRHLHVAVRPPARLHALRQVRQPDVDPGREVLVVLHRHLGQGVPARLQVGGEPGARRSRTTRAASLCTARSRASSVSFACRAFAAATKSSREKPTSSWRSCSEPLYVSPPIGGNFGPKFWKRGSVLRAESRARPS